LVATTGAAYTYSTNTGSGGTGNTGSGGTGNTSSAGSGGASDNLPPSVALNPYIWT
jgi:hypothetical protein